MAYNIKIKGDQEEFFNYANCEKETPRIGETINLNYQGKIEKYIVDEVITNINLNKFPKKPGTIERLATSDFPTVVIRPKNQENDKI